MKAKRAILWFRQDLRVHDNEALSEALKSAEEVIPVYVFDERLYHTKSSFGFDRIGSNRARFIIESIEDLRAKLADLGAELIIRVGITEDIISELAHKIKSRWVFCNRERTQDEITIQDALEQKLWSIGQEVRFSRGKMLYYTADLPFPVTHAPDSFSVFRKEVERYIPVRKPLATPDKMESVSVFIEKGDVPSLEDLGFDKSSYEHTSSLFKGGESEAIKRLNYFIWETTSIENFHAGKDEIWGDDMSSKLSAYLSIGCLSPKLVYHELRNYEAKNKVNKSTHDLVNQLLLRDFFRLMAKKHQNKIFFLSGIKGEPPLHADTDRDKFNSWATGNTGIPFIDANIRFMNQTGFMSNRGRLNVANFLIRELKINWKMGAEYFESQLVDYDPCSNWGNWNYLAGVGSETKDDKYYNIISQAKKYDPEGLFVKKWLPELSDLEACEIHHPDQIDASRMAEASLVLGKDYPKAIVDTTKWT